MFKKTLNVIMKSYQWLETWASRAASWIILLMMFLTTIDVLGRYLFLRPLTGAYEISQLMLLGVVYLAIAYVASVGGHIRVDLVTLWMPWKAQVSLDVFGYILGFIIFAIITWQTGIRGWESWVVKDYTQGLLHIPLWPGKIVIPIGTGMLCIRLIIMSVEGIVHVVRGIKPEMPQQAG